MSDEEFLANLKNIDSEKLIQSLQSCGHDGYYNSLYYPIIEEIKRRLSSTSAEQERVAKVPECRKGEWIGMWDGYDFDGEPIVDIWRCSECDKVFDEWDDKPDWKFCPNCGSYNGGDER